MSRVIQSLRLILLFAPTIAPALAPGQESPIAKGDRETFPGRLEPAAEVEIRSRLTGYLERILVKEGTLVRAGELLVEIDSRPQVAKVDTARAQVAVCEALHRQARANAERLVALVKSGVATREDADKSRADEAVAAANLVVARTQLDAAQVQLGYARVVSPIEGVVSRRFPTVGNLVKADETLLTTVVGRESLIFRIELPEATALRLLKKDKNSAEVTVEIQVKGEDAPRKASIDFVDGRVDPKKGTLLIGGTLTKTAGLLPGTQFIARLPLGDPAPVVPPQAPLPFPKELTTFTPTTTAPIFTGEPGKWDANIRERGWILVEGAGADARWRLYYTGYETKDGIRRLGLATSKDGLTWTRQGKNPLVENEWIEDVCIVKDGGEYIMVAEGKNDIAHSFTSKDGLAWTREGDLDIRQKNGEPIAPGPFGTPTLFHEKGSWYLFYERGDKAVYLASSPDRKVWTHVQDAPVMTPGPAEYDRDLIAVNQVIKQGDTYYALYHGCQNDPDKSKRRWCPGLARSRDLVNWEKYADNPLVPRDENRSSGMVVPVAGGYRLYTTHPAVWAYRNSMP